MRGNLATLFDLLNKESSLKERFSWNMIRAKASSCSVNDTKYFSITRLLSREKLVWKLIIKVVMLSATLFLELLLLLVLLFSYSSKLKKRKSMPTAINPSRNENWKKKIEKKIEKKKDGMASWMLSKGKCTCGITDI